MLSCPLFLHAMGKEGWGDRGALALFKWPLKGTIIPNTAYVFVGARYILPACFPHLRAFSERVCERADEARVRLRNNLAPLKPLPQILIN